MSQQTTIEWTATYHADGTVTPGATWNYITGGHCEASPGCDHCLTPDTLILYADMVWRPIGKAKVGDILVGFDEQVDSGRFRQFKPSIIENIWWSGKETLRLVTEQCQVITTAEHRWLRSSTAHWPTTNRLQPGKPLRQIGYVQPLEVTDDYCVGYMAGLTLGDGTLRYEAGQRSDKLGYKQAYWRIALADQEPLDRFIVYLARLGIKAGMRPFPAHGFKATKGHDAYAAKRSLQKVELRSLDHLAVVKPLLTAERESTEYKRGFLAGIFDAEGTNGDNLRISQNDLHILDRVRNYGQCFGFTFALERYTNHCPELRLVGPLRERMRFLALCQPAITRKLNSLWGKVFECDPDPVLRVEPVGKADVVDIQTSTHTFFANGLATHNCYARTFAERFRGVPGHPYEQGFDLRLWPERLSWPITRWKQGRRIFVNSMGDWLWKDIPDEFTLQAFETMLAATQHTYQLLTKRPSRLANTALMGKILDLVEERTGHRRWPGHIHLGTTVESQAYAWRIEKLRQAVLQAGLALSDIILFVSAEPLLGEMTLDLTGISWLIAGAESGRGARPMEEDWVRNLRDQCLRAETAFFYKQNTVHGRKCATPLLDGVRWTQFPGEREETRA